MPWSAGDAGHPKIDGGEIGSPDIVLFRADLQGRIATWSCRADLQGRIATWSCRSDLQGRIATWSCRPHFLELNQTGDFLIRSMHLLSISPFPRRADLTSWSSTRLATSSSGRRVFGSSSSFYYCHSHHPTCFFLTDSSSLSLASFFSFSLFFFYIYSRPQDFDKYIYYSPSFLL